MWRRGRGKEEGKEKEGEKRGEKKEEKRRRNLSVDLMAAAGLMRASRSALSLVTMPSSSLTTCQQHVVKLATLSQLQM